MANVAQRAPGSGSGRQRVSGHGSEPSTPAKKRKSATARKSTGGRPPLPPAQVADAEPGRCSFGFNYLYSQCCRCAGREKASLSTWNSGFKGDQEISKKHGLVDTKTTIFTSSLSAFIAILNSFSDEYSGSRNIAGNDNGLECTSPRRS